MQIIALGFNWSEVRKRTSSQQIVDEMIHTDDIDIYTSDVPRGVWRSDSASQHFQTAEALSNERKANPDDNALSHVASLIANGDSIDELGLSPLTDGVYFITISPERVAALLPSFSSYVERAKLPDYAIEWVRQWEAALRFANSEGLGILCSCG